ncbi:MAG: peptidylprolyl isomerase [Planctomycetota bacterium]|nr:peptidylprolyl isomerase [Planctomycetota bacterium]
MQPTNRFYSLASLIVLVFSVPLLAQDQPPGPDLKPADTQQSDKPNTKTYFDLLTEWKEIEGKLKAKAAEFAVVGQARKNEIRKEYDGLLESVTTLIPELRKTAIAAYQAAPNQDESLVRLLVGMLTDDLQKTRYDDFFALGDILIQGKVDLKHLQALYQSKRLEAFGIDDSIDELVARYSDAQKNNLPRAVIKTSYGNIVIELFEDVTPNHVANFISLAAKNFYSGSEWHRVEKSINVVQGGIPADGKEKLNYTLAGEWDQPGRRLHFSGHVGAARTSDPNSATSQFYILTGRSPGLDAPGNSYTIFGRVISGMECVHQIKLGDKMLSVEILRKRDHPYKPTPYSPNQAKPDPKPKTKESTTSKAAPNDKDKGPD